MQSLPIPRFYVELGKSPSGSETLRVVTNLVLGVMAFCSFDSSIAIPSSSAEREAERYLEEELLLDELVDDVRPLPFACIKKKDVLKKHFPPFSCVLL